MTVLDLARQLTDLLPENGEVPQQRVPSIGVVFEVDLGKQNAEIGGDGVRQAPSIST